MCFRPDCPAARPERSCSLPRVDEQCPSPGTSPGPAAAPRRTDPGRGDGPAAGNLGAPRGPRCPRWLPLSPAPPGWRCLESCWLEETFQTIKPSIGGAYPGLGRRSRAWWRLRGGDGDPNISDAVSFPDADLSGVSCLLLLQDRPWLRAAFALARERTVTSVGAAGFLLSQH